MIFDSGRLDGVHRLCTIAMISQVSKYFLDSAFGHQKG